MEISLANERVYGDLRLTKVDKDYPDNKLTGAEFEVYRDTNGNKELDEGDELQMCIRDSMRTARQLWTSMQE